MAWGNIAVPGGSTGHPGTATFTLTAPTIAGFPGFTAVYNAQVSSVQLGGMDKNVWVSALGIGSVTVQNPNNTAITSYVLVIGS